MVKSIKNKVKNSRFVKKLNKVIDSNYYLKKAKNKIMSNVKNLAKSTYKYFDNNYRSFGSFFSRNNLNNANKNIKSLNKKSKTSKNKNKSKPKFLLSKLSNPKVKMKVAVKYDNFRKKLISSNKKTQLKTKGTKVIKNTKNVSKKKYKSTIINKNTKNSFSKRQTKTTKKRNIIKNNPVNIKTYNYSSNFLKSKLKIKKTSNKKPFTKLVKYTSKVVSRVSRFGLVRIRRK